MDKFEEEVVQGTLSQGKPCNTSSRNICNELNDKGMKCTYKKKSGTRFGCVSASNQAKSNEKKYKTLIHVPTVMSLMQNKEPLGTLAEFRDILQDAFQLVDGLKQDIRRQFVLNIYNFYIVNFTHWNTSPKDINDMFIPYGTLIPGTSLLGGRELYAGGKKLQPSAAVPSLAVPSPAVPISKIPIKPQLPSVPLPRLSLNRSELWKSEKKLLCLRTQL
mgnify:CR=1 FL=1